jgi:hypothetical protein
LIVEAAGDQPSFGFIVSYQQVDPNSDDDPFDLIAIVDNSLGSNSTSNDTDSNNGTSSDNSSSSSSSSSSSTGTSSSSS